MNALPSSVEASLEEAGFSSTEILILNRLLDEDALTLRELASKTGKSTGVLDQALKKLLKKGIVSREIINDAPKYMLYSLDAIKKWMEEDLKQKREMLTRKQKNFETFISTIARSKERPEMEHFEGAEGVKQAYMQLLEKALESREMLHYFPVMYKEEEDPLREFRVQYFRMRRSRSIFSRVLAHNTPLGRRFQSRDVFEYRKTVLIPPDEYPFTFEQIIVGDTIACFDHEKQKACFVHFPHLAHSQRLLFENLWRNAENAQKSKQQTTPNQSPSSPHDIPFSTRTLSALREFFLSRRSLVIMALCAVIARGITYRLYQRNLNFNLQRIQERVQSIATTGALQIDPADLAELQVEEDWKKPQWAKVVNQLKDIRVNNDDILFIYIFRRASDNPDHLSFIADSHSLNPYANTDDDPSNDVDTNSDGIISGPDVLQWPGQEYPEPPQAAYQALGDSTSSDVYTDTWGSVVTGYAPIRDTQDTTVAVLAVDMRADKLQELSNENFRPLLYFFFLFFTFIFIRLIAFNRSLLRACSRSLFTVIIPR